MKTPDGRFVSIRMLLDPGSELSFVSEDLVHHLGIPRKSATIPITGIGGTYTGNTKGSVLLELYSDFDKSTCFALRAFILPQLTFDIPSSPVTGDSWNHIKGLPLADPDFGQPGPIHAIVGADSYGQLLRPELIKDIPSAPVAQLTFFGWAILGPVDTDTPSYQGGAYHCKVDRDLQDFLTRFWEQEILPESSPTSLSPDEAECEEHFRSTVARDRDGRYVIRLPVKSSITLLGDTSAAALQSLSRMQKRWERDPAYAKLYFEFLSEYRAMGHMVPIAASGRDNTSACYLPHHGVLRRSGHSPNIRVVFNGSSPSSSGVSLNDILHTGASLQTNIFSVLLWFRSHHYVFSSDIVKMYRQILLHPDDRDLQRIFWYDTNGQVTPYRLTTVTYGLKCAPFLALRVLQQLTTDDGPRYPRAVAPLTKGRYVDDIFGGAESLEEVIEIVDQVRHLCLAGGFPLQKWASNHPALLDHFSLASNDQTSNVELDSSNVNVLGLHWQSAQDVFSFAPTPPFNQGVTKRLVLSEIAQLYDPLGLIAPVIVRAKAFLQELWLAKVSWDAPLSTELQERWVNFRRQLPALSKVRIPRWLQISTTVRSISLHGFSDASQLAMAAVVYVRSELSNECVHINLACAKTKVAPLKRITIPRLELNAALMLTRLSARVQLDLNLDNVSIFLWTDSSVVLYWLASHPARLRDYVRNRVSSIQEKLPSAVWRYVPSKENPADCASRGLGPLEIEQHPLWWSGPEWLSQSLDDWPSLQPRPSAKVNLEETTNFVLTALNRDPTPLWDLLERYSSLEKLLRITSLCRRVIARFRRMPLTAGPTCFTPAELQESCYFWVRQIQCSYFSRDIRLLQRGEPLSNNNPLIRLTPFLDRFGLMRVGGRLQHSTLDNEAKHPCILPKHSKFTTLVIADAHARTLHGGTQVTLAYTRQKYWIVGGRVPVRSHILKCVRCARYRGTRAKQLMGQLPWMSVNPSRPFLHAGVDYAGPFVIKTWHGRAAKTYKGYLAIFICFATSATHIEVVTDYTTEAFVAAYKRFTARRGICATLRSDCGTNFVGADRELRRRFETAASEMQELATAIAHLGTEWRFIPPAAPHFGGKWEAAVKSTKFHLRRVIGDTVLTYEELTTLTTQIEAILNSRPLCPMTEDAEDCTALTPGHFIIGEALNVLPEPNLIDQPCSRLTRWQLIRQKVEHFWKRWRKECLQRYQAISKWHHPTTQIREGSLVLLVDERYPPAAWPLARVTQLHPGEDGLTRVVTLRTATTTLKRPILKLCPLPVDQEAEAFGTSVPEGGRNVGSSSNTDGVVNSAMAPHQ